MDEISVTTDQSTLHEDSIAIEERKKSIEERSDNEIQKSIDAVNVQLSKTKFFLVILALIISLAMSSLDISIVATALPTISNQFRSKDEYTWVITAYMLGNTSFQPMFGKFSDIFGRRPNMIFALVLFAVTSALCGAAKNIKMLIIARGFQGIGGGGILAMVNVIIADIVPLRKRGIYMGVVGAVFAFSSVIGPLVGGFFTDKLSWRWAFYINVPVGVIAVIVISLFVNIPTPPGSMMEKIKRIDFLGTFLLVATVVSLLLGLSWGGSKYPWSSATIILLFVGFAIGFTIYLIVEWKFAKEPLTPFQIFKNRNVGLSLFISFTLGITFLGFGNTIPLLYQDGRKISATNSGLRLVPQSFFISIANIGSGFLIGKYGYVERYMSVGALGLIVTSYLITLIGVDSSYLFEVFPLSLFGLAVGLIMQNTILVTQQSAEKKFLAIGTTLNNFFRLIGGVFGVTLIGAIISNEFPKYYAEEYPGKIVTVNDIHDIPGGEAIYTKAIQTSYRAILIPGAVLTLILTLLYGFIPAIGNRKKERKMNEEKLKNMTETKEKNKDIEIDIDKTPNPNNDSPNITEISIDEHKRS
ncbi:MFS general substrate transporter [Anaeromyces robustus]|uniref:MFS general substrate transporter n=1 Tax=Anaeromyces robustus TaxID=1754192 RepID=A0A1Y1XKI5_9FUNG|nr:MFS general substrate transporter [Anaeromyces robustus]|eukprot:ORX86271.1 MFS general substrate transporter [Anaeromyces robustus]